MTSEFLLKNAGWRFHAGPFRSVLFVLGSLLIAFTVQWKRIHKRECVGVRELSQGLNGVARDEALLLTRVLLCLRREKQAMVCCICVTRPGVESCVESVLLLDRGRNARVRMCGGW